MADLTGFDPYSSTYYNENENNPLLDTTRELVQDQYDRAVGLVEDAEGKAVDYINSLGSGLDFNYAITLPTLTKVSATIGDFEAEKPTAPDTGIAVPQEPDENNAAWQDSSLFDQLAADIRSWTHLQITTGGSGIDSDVETALYERGRSRLEVDRQSRHEEVTNYWASRGHVLPPGALNRQLRSVNAEHDRNLADLNRDIIIKQADLEQTMTKFALEQALEYGKFDLTEQIEKSRFVLEKYTKLVQAFEIRARVQIAVKEAAAKIYQAEVQAYSAEIDAESKKILANIEEAKIYLEEYKTEALLKLENAKFEMQNALAKLGIQKDKLENMIKVYTQKVASVLGTIQTDAGVRYSLGYNNSWSNNRSASLSTVKQLQYIANLTD